MAFMMYCMKEQKVLVKPINLCLYKNFKGCKPGNSDDAYSVYINLLKKLDEEFIQYGLDRVTKYFMFNKITYNKCAKCQCSNFLFSEENSLICETKDYQDPNINLIPDDEIIKIENCEIKGEYHFPKILKLATNNTLYTKEMILAYFQPCIVNIKCEKCGSRKIISRSYLINPPKYFVLNYDWNPIIDGKSWKIEKKLRNQTEIDLSDYIIYEKGENKPIITYKLNSIVVHVENSHKSHYIAYVNYKENWYLCNDDIVELVDFDRKVKNCNSYMLFYERKDS